MEDKVTVSQIAIKYGIIIGLVFIVYGMILEFMGLDLETRQIFDYVSFVFLLVAIILAHKAFKEGGDGYMSMGQGLGMGTLISLIGGALSGVFSYIYIKFIDDSMLTKIKDLQIEKMEEQGLDDAQIEQAMEIAGKFMSAEMIPVWAILGTLFFGFILSLIVSLFTKNANPNLEV
jgi:hypothetical protein